MNLALAEARGRRLLGAMVLGLRRATAALASTGSHWARHMLAAEAVGFAGMHLVPRDRVGLAAEALGRGMQFSPHPAPLILAVAVAVAGTSATPTIKEPEATAARA